MNIALKTGIVAVTVTVAATAQAAEWRVDPATSAVSFTAEQQGSEFHGRFRQFDATVDFDPAEPAAGRIVGTVATNSVDTNNGDRDAALTDRDWFDSASFPEARFESESIVAMDDGSYKADGQLTLRDHTKPMTLMFTFETTDTSARFAGRMSIDRLDFAVGEDWNDELLVSRIVDVGIDLSLAQ